MKIFTLLILSLLTCRFCFSQSKELDLLKQQLSIAKHDTVRVKIMSAIGDRSRGSNPDSALFYAEKAATLAKQIKFTSGEIWAIAVIGAALHDLGNLPKALQTEFEALKIAEDSHLEGDKTGPIIFIGRIYFTLKDFDQALYYGRIEDKTVTSEVSKVYAKQNLAAIFEEKNQLDSALYYLNQAEYLKTHTKSVDARLNTSRATYKIYGNIYFKSGNYPLALKYYHKALDINFQSNNHKNIATIYVQIARLFLAQNKPDSSIVYAKKGLAEAQLVSHKQTIFENSILLAELYEKKDSKEALHYFKLATTTKDNLFSAGNIQAMQLMISQEEARQKEIENAKKAYQNQLKQYALLGILGMFLVLSLILYRNNLKEKKAKNLLKIQKEEIQSTLSQLKFTQAQLIQKEKLASLGELTAGIAHEIQNPLNFVNNFSELSVELAKELKEEIEKSPLTPEGGIIIKDKEYIEEIVGDLSQNQEKINLHGKRASSIVKGMLEHSRTSTGERQLTDINQLADEYLRLSYHGLRAKDSRFNSDYELITDDHLPKIEVVPQEIGRVLLNLINNAFYAVNERAKQGEAGYQPKVTVTTKVADNQLKIRVKDNGIGIPEAIKAKIFHPFFTTKPTGEGTGLGLSLAYDIVTKGHRGTMEVESVEGEGTTFIVKLPQ